MHIRGTILVDYTEWTEFITWYMKHSNIRVLKIRDRVSTRYVVDKKDKSDVAYTHSSGYCVTYGIYQPWYEKYVEASNG